MMLCCLLRTTYLGKHVANLEDLQLGASRLVLGLVDRVGHYNLVQCTGVDAIDGISTENTVGDERIHLGRSFLLDELGCTGDGVRRVCQIVDQDGSTVCHVTNEHHGGILPVADLRGPALLVNEGKRHTQSISNGSGSLGASSIWTDDDSLLVVGDVRLDVLAEEMTAVEVVDGNVKETLVLRVYNRFISRRF